MGEISTGVQLKIFENLGLNPHISHGEGMKAMTKYLDSKDDYCISINSLCDLGLEVLTKVILRSGQIYIKRNWEQQYK